ncbi:TolC family protein [Sphingobacterium sp. MYb382]|uniref:TolC family protein n=1 Tax=Sphingobacterium sp. MYb382 TaxID=2745278 RepID=UPI0030A065B6
MKFKFMASFALCYFAWTSSSAQVLKLEDALQRAVAHYDKIKAKEAMVAAAAENTNFQKQQYLPDLTLGAQQSFGTVNMLHGPQYGFGGLGVASSSMPLAEQNWNAAFGSLYFANVNWNLFTFGRLKNEVQLAQQGEKTVKADLAQAIFQHQVKVVAAYLNLLASQQVKLVQTKNKERAHVFLSMTEARAQSGLIPEVDAQLAKAELAHARSMEIKANDKELEFAKQLSVLLDDDFKTYTLDSLYHTQVPAELAHPTMLAAEHPFLLYQQQKVDESTQKEALLKSGKMPSISAFGVVQGRGSGFASNYAQDRGAYTTNYLKGVGLDRSNYLLGFSLSWNISNLFRYETLARSQQFRSKALQADYQSYQKELSTQLHLADAQLKNAYKSLQESKVQVDAATVAFKQHSTLYTQGLTNLVDFTQSLYSLNRAEIEQTIAQNNVWQALLLQAAAHGDINHFVHLN